MLKVTNLFPLLIILINTYGGSSSDNFKVAVVGLNNYLEDVEPNIPADDWLLLMTQNYREVLEYAYNASNKDLDIILFPESALVRYDELDYSTEVPEPHTESPCGSNSSKYRQFFKDMACVAKRFETTIVINLIEKYNCSVDDNSRCPYPGLKYYNTNVALNESGYVSGRYRKWNLFNERFISPAPEAETVTITTKNGHVFGMFTCFDIIFDKPALDLVRREGVKNILFPNRWYSELPFLTALQVQQMWAHENNVTLIASGYNDPTNASWGTAVFVGNKGPAYLQLNYGQEPMTGVTSLSSSFGTNMAQQMPQFEPLPEDYEKNLQSFSIWKDISIPQFSSVVLKTDMSDVFEEVCDGDTEKFCCHFNISLSTTAGNEKMHKYHYHLVAFDGIRSFSGVRYCGIQLCGLIACLNNSLESCGQRFTDPSKIFWESTFEKINITAIFSNKNDSIQYPNSLLSNLTPIPPSKTQWIKKEINNTVERSHILETPVQKLLTFGIFGRVSSRDDQVLSANGTKIQNAYLLVLVISTVATVIIASYILHFRI